LVIDISFASSNSLSWADTAASTIGRLLGAHTPPLPRHTPFLRLPLAPRKSLAGFVAASVTGACIAIGFWGWVAPLRDDAADVSWSWEAGVQGSGLLVSWLGVGAEGGWGGGGWLGLGLIGVVAGLVSGVAEALGGCLCFLSFFFR
jgi:diacylglycerol kinase (CTP)